MLEVFRELEINGDTDALDDFIPRVQGALPKGWRRNEEIEKQQANGVDQDEDEVYVFRCAPRDDRPEIDLFLVRSKGGYRVTNIVPTQVGELARSEYNAVAAEFSNAIGPVAEEQGLEVNISDERVPIANWLSNEAEQRLRSFSGSANMGTGSSHPLDFKRWARFLIQVHREESKLDGDILGRWLVEVEGWPEETAMGLVGEFEFARDLLSAYDQEQ